MCILTSSIDLIETGCDGLCFLAPKVIIEYPNKAVSIFNNVSENDKTEIVNQIQNPTTENNRQSALIENQARIAMDQCGYIEPSNAKEYILMGGYEGLAKALDIESDKVIV